MLAAPPPYLVTPKAYVGPILVGQFGTSIVCRFGASWSVLYRPLTSPLPRSGGRDREAGRPDEHPTSHEGRDYESALWIVTSTKAWPSQQRRAS
jgi:hypothetical protein